MVIERDNHRMASEAVLLQAAAGTVMGGKDAHEAFKNQIKGLTGD